ncbi:hypothetical protein OG21DRAFT_1489572 [Imleria badia]|nr:hypothetical protein OG21DRAFT_1489572 [Imleria badia]
MGRDPPPDQPTLSIDTNPLFHTGTWSWMAAELVMASPGKPISHTAHHDLESLFYILLEICVLFDEPHRFKSENTLSQCFNIYFNMFEPSLLKTITIQSQLGWSFNILRHISLYFRPLIPLLNTLREKIILLMQFNNNSFESGSLITHNKMKKALLKALCNINDQSWTRQTQANSNPLPTPNTES